MKTSLLVVPVTAAACLLSSVSSAAIVKYKATIDGKQEVPATDSTSTGTADLEFDDVANELRGTIELTLADGTKVTNQHVHQAKCGESGSILRPLTAPGMNGIIAIEPALKLDADAAKALADGQLYINIHTEKNPGGEIRGQIFKADSTETCPASTGGTDAGSTASSSSSGGASSSGGPADAGTTPPSNTSSDDGGCSTTGTGSTSNAVLVAAGIALAAGAIGRRRRRA